MSFQYTNRNEACIQLNGEGKQSVCWKLHTYRNSIFSFNNLTFSYQIQGNNFSNMSILNQAAVEALCSATYLENYLETMDNLPDDLQRIVTQLRELDIQCRGIKFMFYSYFHLTD